MDIYFNCSYDNSPVGFQIGKLSEIHSTNIVPECNMDLSEKNINAFIRKCFESGLIRSAYGKILADILFISSDPNTPKSFIYIVSSEYFFIKKKMIHKIDGCNYYMNIAMTGLKWEEFTTLMDDSNISVQEDLAKLIADGIKKDETNIFGYTICGENILKLLDFKYADVCDCPQERVKKIEENNGFYIKMLGKNVDMVMLNQMFGKSLASYCLTRVSPNEICIVKKNNAKMNRFIIVLVGIVLLILAITMVMLLRKK